VDGDRGHPPTPVDELTARRKLRALADEMSELQVRYLQERTDRIAAERAKARLEACARQTLTAIVQLSDLLANPEIDTTQIREQLDVLYDYVVRYARPLPGFITHGVT